MGLHAEQVRVQLRQPLLHRPEIEIDRRQLVDDGNGEADLPEIYRLDVRAAGAALLAVVARRRRLLAFQRLQVELAPYRPALPRRRAAAGLLVAERQQGVGLPAAAQRGWTSQTDERVEIDGCPGRGDAPFRVTLFSEHAHGAKTPKTPKTLGEAERRRQEDDSRRTDPSRPGRG